jgi:hypothetical protein
MATAYVLAGRPLEQVCFERVLGLNEEHTQAFAWYDSADVRISGPFSGQSRVVALSPDPGAPDCFKGDTALRAERGGEYALEARFVWDSAGARARSVLTGTAHVPALFSIHDSAAAPGIARSGGVPGNILDTAFLAHLPPEVQIPFFARYGDTLGKLQRRNDSAGLRAYVARNGEAMRELLLRLIQQEKPFIYAKGDSVFYLNGDLNTLSHLFSSDRSPDVGAVLVTQRFDPQGGRPETAFDSPLGLKPDSGQYYFPGDIRRLILYPEARNSAGREVLDSIGVVNTWFLSGPNRLYFYGFERAYYEFHATATQVQGGGGPQDGDPRVKPRYNVKGGAGIFAGGVPDSFDVFIKTDPLTQVYSLPAVHAHACRKLGWQDSRDCREFYPEYCRAQGWKPFECGADAVRLCLDTAAAKDTALGTTCDSIAAPAAKADTDVAAFGQRLHCIEKGFPGEKACETPRAECLETPGANACKQVLWDYCLDHLWKPDACGPGLASYCHDRPRQSETLCRHADAWCADHQDSPSCK